MGCWLWVQRYAVYDSLCFVTHETVLLFQRLWLSVYVYRSNSLNTATARKEWKLCQALFVGFSIDTMSKLFCQGNSMLWDGSAVVLMRATYASFLQWEWTEINLYTSCYRTHLWSWSVCKFCLVLFGTATRAIACCFHMSALLAFTNTTLCFPDVPHMFTDA